MTKEDDYRYINLFFKCFCLKTYGSLDVKQMYEQRSPKYFICDINNTLAANEKLDNSECLFEVLKTVNKNYPDWNVSFSQKEMEFLKKCTKNTKFIMNGFAYYLVAVDLYGRIALFTYGDAGLKSHRVWYSFDCLIDDFIDRIDHVASN